MNPSDFMNVPGTYALLLHLDHAVPVQIGQLGEFSFTVGTYVYVGSAHGPGGLRARLSRHLRVEKTLHWHIDYLAAHARITAIWWIASPDQLECAWARSLAALPGVSVPVPGFGSSDCLCLSHLFALPLESMSAAWEALNQPAISEPTKE